MAAVAPQTLGRGLELVSAWAMIRPESARAARGGHLYGSGIFRPSGVGAADQPKTKQFVPAAPGGEWTMANIARPPCDEAAILAGSCERPATTNGPWILAGRSHEPARIAASSQGGLAM